MRPTGRTIFIGAAGVVFAVLPAVLGGALWTFWVVFWGLIVLGVGLDLVMRPPRRFLTHTLDAPGTLYVGEPGEATLTVRARAKRPVRLEAFIDLSEHLRPVEPVHATCGPEGSKLTIPLIARRRGTASMETIWIRYGGMLDMLRFTVRWPVDHQLAVVPNVLPVRRAALSMPFDRGLQAGLKIEKYRGDGTEFDSLREFVVGDDTRAIHWKSSARHRSLLCRQFRAERNHQVMLAVDSGRLMSQPLDGGGRHRAGIPKLDHAVTAGLMLAYVGLKSGDRVGLYCFNEAVGVYAPPQGGMAHYRALAHLSARIDYTDAETNYTLGLTTLSQRLRRRSLVVVLTDFVDTITAELMIENLGRLADRHVVVFVTLRDRELERLAVERPESSLALNRAVVASSYLHDRYGVLRRLERLGLHVVDADPAKIGTGLINRYLEIKRRELV